MTLTNLMRCAFGVPTLCAALFVTHVGQASNMLTLGAKKSDDTILAIGSVPKKKKKELQLGALRTREAQLPGGLLSLQDRMQLRAKLGLARQNEVTEAIRGRRERTPDEASYNNEDGDESLPIDELAIQ